MITGELREARWSPYSDILHGKIYGDSKGRFADGTDIVTSLVLIHLGEDTFQTRNSIYRVTSWRK